MTIYNKRYARAWIENYECGKDTYRIEYLEPYLKKIMQENSEASILDVGCGWGVIPKYVEDQNYTGIDINPHFFDYIKNKYPDKKIILKKDSLPKIKLSSSDFDLVICSMVLHALPNLKESIKEIFKKVKKDGKVILIDFNDASEEKIRRGFLEIKRKTKKSLLGKYRILNSGIKLNAEVYFHKEKEFEKEIKKYGHFKKEKLGPIFVAWECIKNK